MVDYNVNKISNWVLTRLQSVTEHTHVLVRDPLQILSESDGVIHAFARNNGFTVIVTATNLVFRELYESVMESKTQKILVIDRAPAGRRGRISIDKAPPPFYPDFLAKVRPEALIDIDLQQYLKETTRDTNWPREVNEPYYARLIARNLDAVMRAHRNLRNADSKRFTDYDLKTIVSYSAFGVADSAFKKLDAEDYWKIGLLAHEALGELQPIAPDITAHIRDELSKAPVPFCWFAKYDADIVLRAFYLSVILSQHLEHWNLLLANIDPSLKQLAIADPEMLNKSAPRLIQLDSQQAFSDIRQVESSLDKDALQLILIDQLKLESPSSFSSVIQKERYSTMIRSLALLMALDNAVSDKPDELTHAELEKFLFTEKPDFAYAQISTTWSLLKEAYSLALKIQSLRRQLSSVIKNLKVTQTGKLNFKMFWELWNKKNLNRLEYFVSTLERSVLSNDLLPRHEDELPSIFGDKVKRIRQQIRNISDDINKQLDELNTHFQEMTAIKYPLLVQSDSDVCLTSSFINRCLKPHWDPKTEKAVIFIFDGMRYEIWDEFLRPIFEDRTDLIDDIPALALLPSETHLSRKAISAGNFPDTFDYHAKENDLLSKALERAYGSSWQVEAVTPDTMGIAETVRYRAKNLDVYVFELCDKELHKIKMKILDGRQVPSRPLSFIYQQLVKNIIDIEIMTIVRKLDPGTKVFITADHGFNRYGRESLWFRDEDLNEKSDCTYTNCLLRSDLNTAFLPEKVRNNIVAFTPEQLRIHKTESRTLKETGSVFHKTYGAIVFPKAGYSFSRKGSPYDPDAYDHGGISIQELMIPMVVLQVRSKDESMLIIGEINGLTEINEGQEAEFRLRLDRSVKKGQKIDDLRIDINATYTLDAERGILPGQVLYVKSQGADVIYRFIPDCNDATDDERRDGLMKRTLTITISYHDGQKTVRKSRICQFTVQLNSEKIVRRIPPKLGNILGLAPKK